MQETSKSHWNGFRDLPGPILLVKDHSNLSGSLPRPRMTKILLHFHLSKHTLLSLSCSPNPLLVYIGPWVSQNLRRRLLGSSHHSARSAVTALDWEKQRCLGRAARESPSSPASVYWRFLGEKGGQLNFQIIWNG